MPVSTHSSAPKRPAEHTSLQLPEHKHLPAQTTRPSSAHTARTCGVVQADHGQGHLGGHMRLVHVVAAQRGQCRLVGGLWEDEAQHDGDVGGRAAGRGEPGGEQ